MDKNTHKILKYSEPRLVSILLYFLCNNVYAQSLTDTAQSQQLPPADIISKNYKISETGIKAYSPDSALKYINNYKDLADIINLNSTAYLKNYGNGALSTVSFRGTGAEHTNVLWNGFQLNNPALGLSDLSLLPSNSSEKVTMLAGGNATSAGSGAIGGAVLVGQNFDKKDEMNFVWDFNTVRSHTLAVNKNINLGKVIINFGHVKKVNDNYFEYIDPYLFRSPKAQMPFCPIYKETFNGSLCYKINKNISFKFLSLYNTYEIFIQPPIGIYKSQGKRNGVNRVNGLHFDFKSKLGITQLKSGLLSNDETYDARSINNVYSRTTISQLQNTVEHFFNTFIIRRGEHKISIAIEHQYIKGEQTNYNTKHIENRTAVMLRYKANLRNKIEISAHVREQFYNSNTPFFSPFIGLQYIVLRKNKNIFLVKSNATKGFRLPTFNERYYQPGGNINIKPENTKQFEAGLVYKYTGKNFRHDFEITYYYNHIYNRVVWINLNSPVYVEPINLKETKINGLEVIYIIATKIKNIEIKSQVNAGYTKSLNVISNTDYKQMIYIPPFKLNWWTELKYKKTSLIYILQQTGVRYTNLDNTDWLQPYLLQNIYLQSTLKNKRVNFTLVLKLINIANVYYQTLQNYALPGRYFETSIIINIQ